MLPRRTKYKKEVIIAQIDHSISWNEKHRKYYSGK